MRSLNETSNPAKHPLNRNLFDLLILIIVILSCDMCQFVETYLTVFVVVQYESHSDILHDHTCDLPLGS